MGAPYEAALTRTHLVGLLAARGELGRALAAAAAAEPVLRGADADRLAANRACALARYGRLKEAERVATGVLPRLRRNGDPAVLAGLLANLGLAVALRGDLAAAEDALLEAVRVAERAGARHQAAMNRANLAFVASRRGDVPRALRLYAAAEPGLFGERIAQCRFDQAETLIAAGLPGEARPLLESTLHEVTVRRYGCDLADGLLLLAHAELADGDPEKAAGTAELARAAFAGQERTGWMLQAEHLLLRARWSAGDRSPVFFQTAVVTAGRLARGGWAPAAADAHIIAALLALRLGRPAAPLLARIGAVQREGPAALRVAAWHATALDRWSRGDRRGTAAAVRAGLRVMAEYAEVFGALELRAHAAGLGTELARLGLRLARSGRELLVAEERRRALLRRPRAVRPPADPHRAALLAELRRVSAEHAAATARGEDAAPAAGRLLRLESALRAHARRSPGPAAGTGRPGDVAGELVRELGDRALVEFVLVDGELHAAVVAGGRCRRVALGSYAAMAQETRVLRFALRRLVLCGDEHPPARAGLAGAARRLDALLVQPLRRALGDRDLVLAPTAELHALPWAVLPSLAGRPLTLVPSAAAWLHAVTPRRPVRSPGPEVHPPHGRAPGTPCGGRVVLVAGPGLECAEAEVAALTGMYPAATVLRGAAARVEEVRRALDGASLAHLAAHGEFRDGNALLSRLRLADGPMLGHDLEELAAPPPLVVLSACDAGRAGAGDAVTGMVGVLLALGAATVVAGVTPVRDSAARDLMERFHRGLTAGHSPARALAALPRTLGDLGFLCFGAG
ncbi:CHAT domain-containing protein [Actinomadura craniellae]|uniref:CHAT domain-containing protein n=1 Tax=Actinomadura craniellae TaxID=2231787 RepID=A0A365GW01_9ACTN|nr:CHAT domain-containing protein [Actinomadura craniellae]